MGLLIARVGLVLVVTAPAAASDLAEVKRTGVLRVLVQPGEPFCGTATGGPQGFDLELLAGFAALQRVHLERVEPVGWTQMIPALLEGRGDVLACGLSDTEERRKRVAFTSEVFPSRDVVLVRAPRVAPRTLEELRVLKVGTIKGTSMETALAAAGVPVANRVLVRTDSLPDAVRAGQVAAAVLPVEHALRARRADPLLRLGLFVGTPQRVAWAVRREDAELKRALDDYIALVRKTPTWSRLVVKYLGPDALEALRGARGE